MKLEMYAIYDSAARAFRAPMFMKSAGLAVRAFTDAVNSPDTELNAHPGDFSLARVGTFEDDSGVVIPEEMGPHTITTARQCINDQLDTNMSPGGTA